MICTKCKIDKPVEEYLTYFHSTYQKTYTRKYCTECYKKQQKEVKTNIKLRKDKFQCIECLEYKSKEEFFADNRRKNLIFTKCKTCCHEEYLRDNGGNSVIPQQPNVYLDNYQKQQTFAVLKTLGYLYDEKLGIWFKKGVKELVDGKIFFPKLRKSKKNYIRKVTPELIQRIKQLKSEGKRVNVIASILDLSCTTIWKVLNDKV